MITSRPRPPRSVFTFSVGPFRWSPFNYDYISGYRRVFWRFWICTESTPALPLHQRPSVTTGLDGEDDF